MRRMFWVFGLSAVLILSGCLDYAETLVIKGDGSGTIKMRYAIDRSYFEQMQAMTRELALAMGEEALAYDPAEGMFSQEQIEAALAEHDAGIQMLAYEASETERDRVWDMTFSFADVNKLYVLSAAIWPDEEEDYDESELPPDPIYTRQSDGSWLFLRSFDDDAPGMTSPDAQYDEDDSADEYDDSPEVESGPDGYDDEEWAAESMEGLAEAAQRLGESAKNRVIRFSITFPGRVVESNATRVEGQTATWEYPLDELDEDVPEQRAVIKP